MEPARIDDPKPLDAVMKGMKSPERQDLMSGAVGDVGRTRRLPIQNHL